MATPRKGFTRIIWVISITASFIWWLLVFSIGDYGLSLDPKGVELIDALDNDFFRVSPLGERYQETEANASEIDHRSARGLIEGYSKNESLVSSHMRSNEEYYNLEKLRSSQALLQDSISPKEGVTLKKFLMDLKKRQSEEFFENFDFESVGKNIPTLDVEMLKLRYTFSPDSSIDTSLWLNAITARAEAFLSPRMPVGKIALALASGLTPFATTWLLWFVINWVRRGFQA